MKTHVITLAKVFPGTHPRKGEPTGFKDAFLNGKKLHTIRGNYDYWEPRIQEVIDGKAILSVREWKDRPYQKPGQQLIADLDASCGLGFKKCLILPEPEIVLIDEEFDTLAYEVEENDHLNLLDFWSWFTTEGEHIIIHFTAFRY